MASISNNHGGPQERQDHSMNQQQLVVSGKVIQQQASSQFHAAQQMSQLTTQHQQRIGGVPVQYMTAYPTVAPLPNGGAYSIIQPQHGAANMGIVPPGAQIIMMAYHPPPPNVAYHSTTPNAHTSLFQQPPPCSIPRMIQPTASTTTHQQSTTSHQYRGPMVSMGTMVAPKVAHSSPDIVVPRSSLLEARRKEHRPQRQQTVYRDFAKDPESNYPPTRIRPNLDQTFPMILYRILSNSECKDCIRWLPHGRGFKICKPKDVEENVLPLYFRHTKLTSFMRQVNGWGFKRMLSGPDRQAYYHEMFLRGYPYLSAKMRRPIKKKSRSSAQELTTHPNFYDDSLTLVALPDNTQQVATRESTSSPTNISSDGACCRDTDGSGGSGSDQGAVMFGGRNHAGNSDRDAPYHPGQDMYDMSTLYNSSGGSDYDSSRLGGNLYGSVTGSDDENEINPFVCALLEEQGCGWENGSSGDVEHSKNHSPPIHIGENISDGTGITSFDPCAAYYAPSRTNRSYSGPDISGEGRTTSDGSSSGLRKSSDLSTSSSNGNSSDGSESGSILHLLTDTALRNLSGGQAPANFMAAGSNISGDNNARDNISSVGSDTDGTEPVSDVSSVSHCWAAFGGRGSSKRNNRQMTSDARIRIGGRESKRARRQMVSAALLVARESNIQEGESSNGSSSDASPSFPASRDNNRKS